jgi:hypothetical protein
MEDPIDRELVVNAINKNQNTWPDSLEAEVITVNTGYLAGVMIVMPA